MYDRLAGNRDAGGAHADAGRWRARGPPPAPTWCGWPSWMARVVGAMAAMPYAEWTPRAHRFLRTTLRPSRRGAGHGRCGSTAPAAGWRPEPSAELAVHRLAGHRPPSTAAAAWRARHARGGRADGPPATGCARVALDTWQDNRPARALYVGAGFEEVAYTPADGLAARRGVAGQGAGRPVAAASAAGHALHLRLGQLGEERQGQRPGGHVLAHRELALAVAEALAVEAHQVDGGQVGLGVDALLAQRADRVVAVDAGGQLDHVDEPAAAVAAGVGARQLQALDARQRLAVQAARRGRGRPASAPAARAAPAPARRPAPTGGS